MLANCLPYTSTRMSSGYLQINLFRMELIIVYSQNYSSSSVFYISIHSIVQAKNTGIILGSSLSPNLLHQCITKNCQCYLLHIYWIHPLLSISTNTIISPLNCCNSLIVGQPDLDLAPVCVQSEGSFWSKIDYIILLLRPFHSFPIPIWIKFKVFDMAL